MTENSQQLAGNNSSQESLILSQETFNSLWNMMDSRGREEMVAGIDAGYLQASAEGGLVPPVQPQANSPLGAQSKRSSLPATCSWPGAYNFQIFFGTQEKVNKHIDWTYSEVDNKLYVRKDALCPFSFKTNVVMSDDVFLRAKAVYTSPANASEAVTRCVNHSQQEILQGLFHAEHLIRSDSQSAYYDIDTVTKRHSVVVPFENPPVGQDYSTYIFKFVCFSSCAGGPNRRPLALIFTLEQGNNVFGRIVLDLKICACPGRDRQNAETSKLPQSTTAGTVSKRKTTDSSTMIPQNYFENLPKKKKLEEGKPEKKEEFTIKVKDVECYNFLVSMKRLFLGHKRFGRLPPECRALLQLYKSSSDEDEKS